jgi:hypothetical protein
MPRKRSAREEVRRGRLRAERRSAGEEEDRRGSDPAGTVGGWAAASRSGTAGVGRVCSNRRWGELEARISRRPVRGWSPATQSTAGTGGAGVGTLQGALGSSVYFFLENITIGEGGAGSGDG